VADEVSLTNLGSITGVVTAEVDGSPIRGTCVTATGSDGSAAGLSYTDDRGRYVLGNLALGAYVVGFNTCHATEHEAEYYENSNDASTAKRVTIAADRSAQHVDAALAGSSVPAPAPTTEPADGARPAPSAGSFSAAGMGGITGTVTSDSSGLPVADICVRAIGEGSVDVTVLSDASGEYEIPGLFVGEYQVSFAACLTGTYAPEFFDDVQNPQDATPVIVEDSTTTPDIDAGLAPTGRVTGTVTADAGGAGLAGICVWAAAESGFASSTQTTTDGTYELTGLPSGPHQVRFYDCTSGVYAGEIYDDLPGSASPTVVSVVAGETTLGIDAGLSPGGRISGVVTGEETGLPLANICVYASGSVLPYCTLTDADGAYEIGSLAPGQYKVSFYDFFNQDYVREWYEDVDFDEALLVPVTVGTTTGGIDAVLAPAGHVSGVVTADDSGLPLPGICVFAQSGTSSESDRTDENGAYDVGGLADGTALVQFYDCTRSHDHLGEYYDDTIDFAQADLVTVTAGATTSGIDASLARAGHITGTVTSDETGLPVADLCVNASGGSFASGQTDQDGAYDLGGLTAGSYVVQFSECFGGGSYISEYYDDTTDYGQAEPVVVTAGATTSGIDASLARAGHITGTVTSDETGLPLASICVSILSSTGGGGFAQTGVDGSYDAGGLAAGMYTVFFYECSGSGGHVAEYYDDTTDPAQADPVTVTAGATTSGIDAGLAAAGHITGTVTADDTGLPLANICVGTVSNGSGVSAQTGADGTYDLGGLAPGSYLVTFQECSFDGDYLFEYFDDTTDFEEADAVTVGAGATTTGIDASLATAGHITGTVTSDDTGLPLANICVLASEDGGTAGSFRLTASDGSYDLAGLPTGGYVVELSDCNALGYATEYFDDVRSRAMATPVPVTAGEITAGIDAGMGLGASPGDFDGNGTTDVGVFRPSVGGWYLQGQDTVFFGLPGDIPVPADYDGDGITDRAVFRPAVGGWYIEDQPTVFYGLSGDVPVPGDYDGDGDDDPAVYRSDVGGWYVHDQPTEFHGLSTDTPVPADYDGDGTTDIAVFRPEVGGWYIAGHDPIFLGLSSDTPVPGDYDGDGVDEPAVYRNGEWIILNQATVYLGLGTDTPVPGDYDGDRAIEPAVFRPDTGAWYIQDQPVTYHGLDGDVPTPKRPTAG
jgi:hypothetical protein